MSFLNERGLESAFWRLECGSDLGLKFIVKEGCVGDAGPLQFHYQPPPSSLRTTRADTPRKWLQLLSRAQDILLDLPLLCCIKPPSPLISMVSGFFVFPVFSFCLALGETTVWPCSPCAAQSWHVAPSCLHHHHRHRVIRIPAVWNI